MRETTPYVYQLGPYLLEPGKGVTRAGTYIPLPPKELALLEVLVIRDGDIVSHEELWNHVWPDQDASCDSITRCIYMLRRALGGTTQQYIMTVPRQGYRLATPVTKAPRESRQSLIEKSIRTSPAAYAHFLEGLREANLSGPEHQQRAIELFEQARQMDSSYTVPLGAIADCRVYQLIRGWAPPNEGGERLLEACQQALAIDKKLVSALAARGWHAGLIDRDIERGLEDLDKTLALDPNHAKGYAYMGWLFRAAGRLRESIEIQRSAVNLDPHSLLSTHALAWSLFCGGEPEEALDLERQLAASMARVDVPQAYVALFGSWLGHEDEALTAGYAAADLSKNDPMALSILAFVLARLGHEEEAWSVVARAEEAKLPRCPRTQLAMVYAELGDKDRTVSLLTEARDEKCPWFLGARYDPRLGELAHDSDVQFIYRDI